MLFSLLSINLQTMNRRIIKTIVKCLLIAALIIYTPVVLLTTLYKWELWLIEYKLNSLEDIEVLHIWGHKDVTLEEISARVKVGDEGEIVLNNLSKDVNEYPDHVFISEIGGYSFTRFECEGKMSISSYIDIGSSGSLGKLIGVKLNTPADVIMNYKRILLVIEEINANSSPYYSRSENQEVFIFIENKAADDIDPLFQLQNIEQKYEFAKKLKWQNSECSN